MERTATGGGAVRIASAGHAAYAATLIGLGLLGLIKRDFAALWQSVPQAIPGRAVLVYLCALIPLASGIGLLTRRGAAAASRLALVYFLLWLVLLRVPHMLISFNVETWWASCKTAVMAAAAWVLYVWFVPDRDSRRPGFGAGEYGLRIARDLYGVALIPFGLAHFLYLQQTSPLVPSWLPAHVAFAYFTGGTFIAAGVAILFGVHGRLAAALSALQMGLFTLLVWVPIVAGGAASAFQWGEFEVSIAMTVGGWVVADSYRGASWFAARSASSAT
jgi:uncharacterized membrane protein